MYIHPNETVLSEGRNRLGRTIYLIHRPEGDYPAGSLPRHDPEGWGVLWEFEGCRHGQWRKTLEDARADFAARNVEG